MLESGFMTNTFVYGSLMFDAVWDKLIRRRYRKQWARLDGYTRLRVTGEVYPGLVASDTGSVDGVVIEGVSNDDIFLLDRFEGEYYSRQPVTVVTRNNEPYEAQTYVFREEFAFLLSDCEWSAEEFGECGIREFLSGYGGFVTR